MKILRHPLKQFYGRRDLHFVTFSCYRRRPYLGTVRARNRFVRILHEVRLRHAFALIGYVVMPEHVHLLIGEPPKGNPSKVLQVLKQKVSRSLRGNRISLPTQLRLPFASEPKESRAFWQRRFYDFNVWSEKKLREKLHYMHKNPVDRRLVTHPKDWPWSSWSHYALGERGLIAIDLLRYGGPRENPHPENRRDAAPLSHFAIQRVRHPPGRALEEDRLMGIRFLAVVFFVGVVISGVSLWTLRGCGRYFQMGLYWFLAYLWPQQLGRGAFVVNAVFHGLSLALASWIVDLGLKRIINPAQSKLASTGVALVLYCALLFMLFPIKECTL